MMVRALASVATVCGVLAGCVETGSPDPAEGGFFTGVSGIASGSYNARIDQRETEVAAAESRNRALAQEQSQLAARIGVAERQLADERATLARLRIGTAGVDASTSARVQEVLTRQPSGRTEVERLADLQKTIADARRLSAELSRL